MVTKETDHARLVALMVGRELGDLYEKHDHRTDEVVLKVEHLASGKMVRDAAFELYKGEVLGSSGLVGSGRTETMTSRYVDGVMDTKYATLEQPIAGLSVGDQQKVIISRWLLATDKVLILDEPTGGIDIKAKSDPSFHEKCTLCSNKNFS